MKPQSTFLTGLTLKEILQRFLLAFVISFSNYAYSVDFQLTDLDGKPIKLSDFKGQWVLVNYWATWCSTCIEEIPELNQIHQQPNRVVLGVNMEQLDPELIGFFAEEQSIEFPVLLSPFKIETELGKVEVLPTSFLISPDGEILAKKVGRVSQKMVEKFISLRD